MDLIEKEMIVVLKNHFNLRWLKQSNLKKYIQFIFLMADCFAKKGLHGAKISDVMCEVSLSKGMIFSKSNKQELFLLVVDCCSCIFNHTFKIFLLNDNLTEANIHNFFSALELYFVKYKHFAIISFLGGQFNDEMKLISQIQAIKNQWLFVFEKFSHDATGASNEIMIAENCYLYLLAKLMLIQNSDSFEEEIKIVCQTLKKYLIREVYYLI